MDLLDFSHRFFLPHASDLQRRIFLQCNARIAMDLDPRWEK